MAIAEAPTTGAQPEAPAPLTSPGSATERPQPAVWVNEGITDAFGSSTPTAEATPNAQEDASLSVSSPMTETGPAAERQSAPATQPATVTAVEAEPQPTKTLDETDVERRVQAALTKARQRWEREQAEAERQRQEREREQQAAAARARAEQEEADLYRRWKGGDPDAEQKLLERYGTLLEGKYSEEQQRVQQVLQEREQAAQRQMADFAVQKWREHAEAFGADPEADDLVGEQGPKDMRSLNLHLLKKTGDEALVMAMRENPGIVTWVAELQQQHQQALETLRKESEEAVTKAKAAAANDTQARLIGSGQIPPADVSGANGGAPQSVNERLQAFADDPQNQELYKWFTEVYQRQYR